MRPLTQPLSSQGRTMTDEIFKRMNREIKQLKGEKKRLENMLIKLGAMQKPPCFICGYNGEGYYQPENHRCAAKHHRLRQISTG